MYGTSDDLPCIYPIIVMSHGPVLSKNVISSVPMRQTVTVKCREGIIMLAHGQKCQGAKHSVPVPSFICHHFPHLHITLDHQFRYCGHRLSLMRHLRRRNGVIIIHPVRGVRISHLSSGARGLATLCGRKCTYTRGVLDRCAFGL